MSETYTKQWWWYWVMLAVIVVTCAGLHISGAHFDSVRRAGEDLAREIAIRRHLADEAKAAFQAQIATILSVLEVCGADGVSP